MGFQQGISGLSAAAKAMDVTGNNIANSATVGFKSSRTNFGDVYAASMLAGGTGSAGLGVSVSAVQQQFTQGTKTLTSNSLDLAISGAGFYRLGGLQDTTGTLTGAETYTRNGQFHMNKDGFIVNDQDLALIGVQADATGAIPDIIGSNLGAINVSSGVGKPKASDTASLTANMDANSALPTVTTFDPEDSKSYNFSRGMSVYDTQGGTHSLTYYFVKADPATTPNQWNVYCRLSDTDATGQPLSLIPTEEASGSIVLQFDNNGKYVSATNSVTPLKITFDGSTGNPVPAATGTGTVPGTIGGTLTTATAPSSVDPLAIQLDFTKITQFHSQFSIDMMTQNGYPKGKLAGLNVDQDGVIVAQYDNGKTSNVGRLALFDFANKNGLANLGNNQWAETGSSGVAVSNYAGVGNVGTIQSFAVEESNVDLTQELVNLIVQQRNYQANAQTIKTQDQVMQTLVNLR